MFINKNLNLRSILSFTGFHIIWLTLWAAAVTSVYEFTGWYWMTIPWLPLSVIGTAVAFYVGFKNSQAYERLWEARKIWGAIVNSSRAWGSTLKAYISTQFSEKTVNDSVLDDFVKSGIYRHIAWLYTLRSQLLEPTPWEHINQNVHIARITKKRMKTFGIDSLGDQEPSDFLNKYLGQEEADRVASFKNVATHIIDNQSQLLKELRSNDLIDDFRHMDLQNILKDFYVHQGKCERIKKFPFPRQYGAMSFVFVAIFIFLLPLGMVSEFAKLGEFGTWLSIPFTVLVGWVYLMMELIGDYSENPFEGLGNDIPMLSLCKTIEIDLKEMLGETELPEPVKAKNGVMM